PGFYLGHGREASYETPYWPPDFFKNYHISIAYCLSNRFETKAIGAYDDSKNHPDTYHIKPYSVKIESSTRDGELRLSQGLNLRADLEGTPRTTRCVLWGWNTGALAVCREEDLVTDFTVQDLQPGKYYLPILCGFADEDSGSSRAKRLGFAPYERIRRDDREHRDERRQWVYGGEDDDAEYIRASSGRGCATVYVRSGSDCDTSHQNQLLSIAFLRPEVIELINVSPHPISLKNWTLTFNTGTIANDIGRITSCYGYSPRGGYTMSNPLIDGNGYMYLVNDVRLFNAEFGSGVPQEWGRNASQQVPVWEIPKDSWGVQYRITGHKQDDSAFAEWIKVYTRNEHFDTDQFAGEVLELRDTRNPDGDKDGGHGTRYGVAANGPNWFEIRAWTIGWQRDRFDPQNGCDTMMLVGMPAKGGVVSMTLKNEYKQIASRTIEYDYLDQQPREWYGRSVEKVDPTHYNWRVVQQPSIDGRPRGARNRSMRGSDALEVVIKNGPFNSVAELQRVRSSRDFENIGAGRA
ncbi:MAG: hypothetical protein JJ992_11290, partial [Planctomycetes bacterium]|nr:hypothetical protein [Planctomycetota bacterium]